VCHHCVAWRDLASNIADSLKKSDEVILDSTLGPRCYADDEGETHVANEVTVNENGTEPTLGDGPSPAYDSGGLTTRSCYQPVLFGRAGGARSWPHILGNTCSSHVALHAFTDWQGMSYTPKRNGLLCYVCSWPHARVCITRSTVGGAGSLQSRVTVFFRKNPTLRLLKSFSMSAFCHLNSKRCIRKAFLCSPRSSSRVDRAA